MEDAKRAAFDKPGARARRFAHALASSYLFLGANVFYTLAATPIALHYLSKTEFGLWALTLQIASYIQWIDLGMWSWVSRILIDHKDYRAEGRYGGAIKSGILVESGPGGDRPAGRFKLGVVDRGPGCGCRRNSPWRSLG